MVLSKKSENSGKALKIGFILAILTSFLGLVGATTLGTQEQGEDIELYQTCNNCTYCNFTAIKYNGENILANVATTQNGTYFYYILDGGNTSEESGELTYCYDCGNSVDKDTGCISFKVNKSGKDESFNLFLPLVVILFFSILSFIFGINLKENKIFRYSLFGFAILMAYIGIQYTLIVIQDYSIVGETEGGLGFFLIFFQAITWIIGGGFTLSIIWIFLQLRKWFNIKKGFLDGGNLR